MKTKYMIWIGTLLLLLAGAGCEKNIRNKEEKIHVEEFSYSGCKDHLDVGNVSVRTAPENQEYVKYEGNSDGYLSIRHINVVFNCCPDTIKATASIERGVLLITEKEIVPKCNCTCKYDLTYKIGPLTADRKYTLRIYRGTLEYANFSFTYDKSLKNKIIIQKNNPL